jgi:hypothetical protein
VPSFTVTAAGQRVNLDAAGTARASFTVTNTSPQALRGQLFARKLGEAKPEWFTVVGDTVRDFAPGEVQQVVVELKVPPGSAPGSYSFRLDAVSEADPDEDFTEGQSVAFDVAAPPPPPPKKKFPWWILAIVGAVVLLIVIGLVVWLLTRGDDESTTTTAPTTTTPTPQGFDPSRLKVVVAGSRNVPGGAVGVVTASCPEGEYALSGGYNSGYRWYAVINAPSTTNKWEIRLVNPTSGDQQFQVQLLCYAPPAGFDPSSLKVVVAGSRNVPGGGVGLVDGSCSEGEYALSGGYNSGYRWYAEWNAPISTNKWRVGLINPTSGEQQFQVQLLCYAG